MHSRILRRGMVVGLAIPALVLSATTAGASPDRHRGIDHIVVINEQYQIDGGRMNRYVAGSDAVGLTMGHYDTRGLPIYEYLHDRHAPHYAVADRFFQGAFGGSFLNHQWLITPNTPTWPDAVRNGSADDLHSIVGPDGFPAATPLHPASPGAADRALTQAANPDGTCAVPAGVAAPPAGTACGDFAINTIQPPYQPYATGTPVSRR